MSTPANDVYSISSSARDGRRAWLVRLLAAVTTMLMAAMLVGPASASDSLVPSETADPSGSPSAAAIPVDPSPAGDVGIVPRGEVARAGKGRSVVPVLALLAPTANPVALSGSRVEVYQLNSAGKTGQVLATGRTGRRGATSIRLGSTPNRVLIKVTGGRTTRKGKAYGKPFKGSLTAVVSSTSKRTRRGVQHYFPGTAVNLQSTVLTAYAGPRPAKKWQKAKTKVSKFLGLPHNVKAFAYDYSFNAYDQELFNSASFLAQARRAGGVNKFVKKLSHDIAAGKKPHPFPRPTKKSRTSVRAIDPRPGALTGPGVGGVANISSIAGGVMLIGKVGFGMYDLFTGQTKNDDVKEMTAEFETINGDLADIISAIGTLQTSIDDIGTQISEAGADQATSSTSTEVVAIQHGWTQQQLVVAMALQVCDTDPSACNGRRTLLNSVDSFCNPPNAPSNQLATCESFTDNLDNFNTMCQPSTGGTGGIQATTLNLAALVGGQAVGGAKGAQGVTNSIAQSVSTANSNVISPSGLEYLDETWAWYYYITSLGDALDAVYLGLQLGGPLPGEPGTTVTTEYIQGQINSQVAPTMNMLAGTYPSMPANTALSSNSGGGGTAYLWPTQIGSNAPQAWNNNDSAGNANGSPWVFATNASNQVNQITNSNDSTANRDPIVIYEPPPTGSAYTATKVATVRPPTVSTLLPKLDAGVKPCDTDNDTVAPPAGTCAALIIGQTANGNPTFQTAIAVTSAAIPSWQVATSSAFSQLFAPFQAENPTFTAGALTAGQLLVQSYGFSESLIAQGSSNGFAGQSGMFAFASGSAGFFGGCTPAENPDCHLLTWDSGSPTGLRDLNTGYYITSQSGNWNSGCSGGGFGGGNWNNFANWTVGTIWSGPAPCGTTKQNTNDTDPTAPPLWNYLNGLAITPLPPLASQPPDQTYLTFNSNPYFSPWGLLTLFTAPVASNYCFASYYGGNTSAASACLQPRTQASDVTPVPTGS